VGGLVQADRWEGDGHLAWHHLCSCGPVLSLVCRSLAEERAWAWAGGEEAAKNNTCAANRRLSPSIAIVSRKLALSHLLEPGGLPSPAANRTGSVRFAGGWLQLQPGRQSLAAGLFRGGGALWLHMAGSAAAGGYAAAKPCAKISVAAYGCWQLT